MRFWRGRSTLVGMRMGMVGLGVWLVLTGLESLVSFHFSGFPMLMAVLALVSGVLILIGR